LVALDDNEYLQAMTEAADAAIAGGALYDALIARCALKAKAKNIYTWNTKHFERLGADIARRVQQP